MLVERYMLALNIKQRGSFPRITPAPWCSGSTGGSNPPGPGSTRWWGDQYHMRYKVYLHKGIYYETTLNPGDKLKRVEFKDKFRTTHIWIKA